MSLINDALKRARLGQKKQDGTPPETPPLEPVESGSTPKRSPVIWISICMLLLVGGLWLVWKWWNSPAQSLPLEMAQTTVTNAVSATVTNAATEQSEIQATPIGQTETATNEVEISVADVAPVATETNVIAALEEMKPAPPLVETNVQDIASATPPEPPEPTFELQPSRPVTFPPLKLQGIFFRMTNPSVLINNLTLFIGDKVDGVSVVQIQRTKVTLELNGSQKVLFLK